MTDGDYHSIETLSPKVWWNIGSDKLEKVIRYMALQPLMSLSGRYTGDAGNRALQERAVGAKLRP